ncbi:MAG: type II toxin-antitoxin system HicB family antitoxin [Chloroflexota bacterium]
MRMAMKLNIIMYQDEDKMFIAECPVIPGCVSQGKTRDEARENIKKAIRECLKVRKELNMPLVVEEQVEVTM